MKKKATNPTRTDSAGEDMSDGDRQRYIEDLEELQKEFNELEARVDRVLEPHLKELAGPYLETMLNSPEDTLKYLTDPNPSLRQAALQSLTRSGISRISLQPHVRTWRFQMPTIAFGRQP